MKKQKDMTLENEPSWSGVQYATGEEQRAGSRKNWEGNRQEGQGSPNRGNSLQVSDIFFISLLSGRRKQATSVKIFFPLLYTNLNRSFF